MSKSIKWMFLAGLLFALFACATQPPPSDYTDVPGFLLGILHGFLMILTFIGSFFTDYRMYAFPNSGWSYDLGYIIGVILLFFSMGGIAAG